MTMQDVESIQPILLGRSLAIARLRTIIMKVAPTPVPVFIHGPRGVGKELVATALHAQSARPGRFVAFNASAIADSMFEATLFGHVRGAFTGATGDVVGYLGEAHRGTVFLDEVTGVSASGQQKLLRALESSTFRPIGARRDHTSDFRVIAAANEDVGGLVDAGRFRADLVDRLTGFVIGVPPLSERVPDIEILAEHFLATFDGSGEVALSRDAVSALEAYSWPGNVRQLKYVLQRAALLSSKRVITAADIDIAIAAQSVSYDDRRPMPLRSANAEERAFLLELLQSVAWDTARAAVYLGVSRSAVYRRMARAGIDAAARRGRPVAVD